MKVLLRKGLVAAFLISMVTLLSACSNDAENVRKYNDSIVGIQKKMVQKGENLMKDFGGDKLDVDKIVTQLVEVQGYVKQSNAEFTALEVPKGGETLSAAMKNFFVVEAEGMDNLIVAVKNLKGKEQDQKEAQKFIDTVNEFTKKEQSALDHFNQIQQEVAKKYGQRVEDSAE